jgi:hypothetical protein
VVRAEQQLLFLFGINKEIVPGVIHETQTAIGV